MKRIDNIEDLRAILGEWHPEGDRIALVPTMGNLHKGHLSLVELAKQHAERVIVSVFVNPTQFGPKEDFSNYPRTLERDAMKLSRSSADVLFTPSVDTIYPEGAELATQIVVPGVTEELEGAQRPGHFAGVASVVTRLFNICHPNVAIFGQKDYQQFVVLKRLARDLHIPVRLIAGPIVRDANGLALSSRNSYLDEGQCVTAGALSTALATVAAAIEDGHRDYGVLEKAAAAELEAAGLEPDYVTVRDAEDLQLPGDGSTHLVALAAARMGDVRLIDNMLIEVPV